MVEIRIGGCYKVSFVKTGESDRGPWQLIKVPDEKRKSGGATFFATRPIPGLAEGDVIRIDGLYQIVWKAARSKKHEGEWIDVTDVTFNVSRADGSASVPEEEVDTSGELPF